MADHNIEIVSKDFFDWKTKGKKVKKETSISFSKKSDVETMKLNIMQSLKRCPCVNVDDLSYGVVVNVKGIPHLELYSVQDA